MTGTVTIGGTITAVIFTQRAHRKVMNVGHRDTMYVIRDVYLPFHFNTVAYSRYPGVFKPRSRKWQILKARVKHHQRPNVWSGRLQLAVLTSERITATATKGTFTADAPKDTRIEFGPSKGKLIRRPLNEDRRKELEFVSQGEIDEQCERLRNYYIASAYDPVYSDKLLRRFRS